VGVDLEMDSETKELLNEMTKKLSEAMKPQISSGFELASKPFQTVEESQKEEMQQYILRPNEEKLIDKELTSFSTGTFLDELFLNHNEEPIGGVPFSGQFGIVGMPDAGKSILMEEIAVKVSGSGRKVLFVTSEDIWRSETPRFDLENRMKQKADIMQLDWETVKDNLFVIDTVTNSELNDWYEFARAYKFACENYNIDLVIIDSITVLQDYRGALKYRLMELIKYNQKKGITALFVNQRSKAEWDSYDIAGGVGLAHNLDGTVIIDFGSYWDNMVMKRDYEDEGIELKRKMMIRFTRVLGCRMSNFIRRYVPVEITSDGFLRRITQ